MITDATTQRVLFRMCVWDGSEKEIREFAGDACLRLQEDGTAVCMAARDHVIRLRPGDYMLKPVNAELPMLWFFGDDPWTPVLFQEVTARERTADES